MKIGTRTVTATVAQPKYKVNVNTLEHTAAKTLELNEIGVCNLSLDRPVPFDPYAENRDMGGFILIDRFTNATVAAGLLHFALRRADNVHWQAVEVDKTARAALNGQQPAVVWFTGLSGAGKSTIANIVEQQLHDLGRHTYLLDGDNVRHGLNQRPRLHRRRPGREHPPRRRGRPAHGRRRAHRAGVVHLAVPRRAAHGPRPARRRASSSRSSSTRPSRSPRPATARASTPRPGAASSRNFTGIDSPYEPPEAPELHLDASGTGTVDDAAAVVIAHLRDTGILSPPENAAAP